MSEPDTILDKSRTSEFGLGVGGGRNKVSSEGNAGVGVETPTTGVGRFHRMKSEGDFEAWGSAPNPAPQRQNPPPWLTVS